MQNVEEAGAPTSFPNAVVPAEAVSPLNNNLPSSAATHPAAAANTSIPDTLRMVTLKLSVA